MFGDISWSGTALSGLVVVLGLTAACDAPPEQVTPTAAAVLSDTGGPVRLAVTVVTSPARTGLRDQALIETLTRRLGPRTHLLILADPEMILEPNPWPQRMTFVRIPQGLRFSMWPQDPFVVVEEPGSGSRLLVARDYGREMDHEMAPLLARHLGWPIEESTLFFAGGNVLSDAGHAFLGESLVQKNAEELEQSREEIVRRFEQELGKPVIRIAQAVAHIDMVVTPLGDGRIAVADATAGAELAERLLATEPETVRAFEEHARAGFFGDPAVTSVINRRGQLVTAPAIVGETRRAIADSRETARTLDEIAGDLRGRGYETPRIPFLGTHHRPPDKTSYPMLSYNNVLLERVEGRDRVYVAQYGLDALDERARRSWEAAGFEVHQITGVTTSAMYRGSVRCTVKVLERGLDGP